LLGSVGLIASITAFGAYDGAESQIDTDPLAPCFRATGCAIKFWLTGFTIPAVRAGARASLSPTPKPSRSQIEASKNSAHDLYTPHRNLIKLKGAAKRSSAKGLSRESVEAYGHSVRL
jgi:hypothetical protein